MNDFKKSRERKFLDQLLSETGKSSGLGVLGPEKTLEALRRGQVRILAIRDSAESPGWICQKDYYLSSSKGQCPYCEAALKLTEDLFGHMVWEAIDQRSEIRFIKNDDERFDEAEVGALLRFR